jgi:hypothetical protein
MRYNSSLLLLFYRLLELLVSCWISNWNMSALSTSIWDNYLLVVLSLLLPCVANLRICILFGIFFYKRLFLSWSCLLQHVESWVAGVWALFTQLMMIVLTCGNMVRATIRWKTYVSNPDMCPTTILKHWSHMTLVHYCWYGINII